MAKMLYRKDTGEILGVHIFGLHAADLIHEASNAIATGQTVQVRAAAAVLVGGGRKGRDGGEQGCAGVPASSRPRRPRSPRSQPHRPPTATQPPHRPPNLSRPLNPSRPRPPPLDRTSSSTCTPTPR
jgi:hypothetical protein